MNDNINRQQALDAIRNIRAITGTFDDEILLIDKAEAQTALMMLPPTEPEIIHCKDCKNRGEDECPMRHIERIEWEEDGYIEVDDVIHDYTEPYGYCDKGERNE